MKELILPYVKYNLWANDRLTGFINEHCSEELADRELVSSFPSLRKTLLHTWGAECIWLMRLHGNSPSTWTWMEYKGSLSELREEILKNDRAWIEFVSGASEEILDESFAYKAINGNPHTIPVSEAIQHCMNHSTFHRGQAITLLRQLGFTKLFSTDFIEFTRSA